ncbi:MAG: CsgG/HfaB family protein, partial [Treponema sp.]|nr:CsgG/HfaB family protein [Treponema sp.]
MKRVMLLAGLFCGVLSVLTAETAVTIDTALSDAVDRLTDSIPERSTIAVLSIKAENVAISNYVLEGLLALLVNGRKFVVVDRSNLDLIRQEENLQLGGEISDESAQRIGHKLAAQMIIFGSMKRIGNYYHLQVRALEVETTQIQGEFFTADVLRDDKLKEVERTAQPKNWIYLGARVGL